MVIQRAVTAATYFREHEYGYFLLQSTRPQTVGYALTDSPVGQAAWIYEKFQAWTDNDGDVESVLSRDEMLDDISLYWLSQTAASSARIYWENSPASFAGGPPRSSGGSKHLSERDLPRAPLVGRTIISATESIGTKPRAEGILRPSSSPSFSSRNCAPHSEQCVRRVVSRG